MGLAGLFIKAIKSRSRSKDKNDGIKLKYQVKCNLVMWIRLTFHNPNRFVYVAGAATLLIRNNYSLHQRERLSSIIGVAVCPVTCQSPMSVGQNNIGWQSRYLDHCARRGPFEAICIVCAAHRWPITMATQIQCKETAAITFTANRQILR